MAFSDYKTIAQVQTEYCIKYEETRFLSRLTAQVPASFASELRFNIDTLDAFSSEAARCELIILPVLREVYKKIALSCSLWIQKSIRYDEHLNGSPDYMISKRSELGKTVLSKPLLMIAEAKKNDFEQGWAQCLAELVAAQKINQNEQSPVYGIVTDGKYWEFGKLAASVFTKNSESFSLDNLTELFAALETVFDSATQTEMAFDSAAQAIL
jgi:hypothetical protein